MKRRSFPRVTQTIAAILLLILIAAIYFFSKFNSTPFKANVQFVTIKNAKIAYYTRGKGSPLILIPGFAMTMQDWDPELLRELSIHHKLIVFDYRGIGKSTGDLSNLNEDQLASDTIELMDMLKIKKTNILGWSLGSFVGQRISEKYPERVTRLVLIATAPGEDKIVGGSKSIGTTIQNNLNGSWESFYIPLMFPNTPDGKSASQTYLNQVSTALQNGELPSDRGGDTSARAILEQAFSNTQLEQDRTAELSTIRIPTLIIVGQNDTLVPIQNDKFVTNRILNAELKIIPNAGHAVLFQYPDQVSQLTNQFLK